MEKLATDGGRTDLTVRDQLYHTGQRFDFYQAVRLLEQLHPDAVATGATLTPAQEAVRFQSTVGFAFATTDVAAVTQGADPQPDTMLVNFLGLAGALGPLPTPYTKLLLDRLRDGDPVLRDFLDLFNHRLVTLLYQVRKTHRAGFAWQAPGQDRFTGYLFALIGLGSDELRNRMVIDDRALLRYAGLLAPEPRSAIGLERLLSDYFQVDVRVEPFAGQWVCLDADQWTTLGATGRNQRLGDGFLMGQRLYDSQGKVTVHLGPLGLKEYLDFLPIGRGFAALGELVRFYGQDAFAFDLQLSLLAAEVPGFRLGVNGTRLGWTSWLKTKELIADDAQRWIRPTLPNH